MIKRILIALLAVLVVIQFFRPAPNTSPKELGNTAVGYKYPVSQQVQQILDKACNDCHSNNTRYPWYSKVQPFAWWLDNHIREGKHELNFDEFLTYNERKQQKKFDEISEVMEEGSMPLSSYTWIHRDAKLTDAERSALSQWAKASMQQAGGTAAKDKGADTEE